MRSWKDARRTTVLHLSSTFSATAWRLETASSSKAPVRKTECYRLDPASRRDPATESPNLLHRSRVSTVIRQDRRFVRSTQATLQAQAHEQAGSQERTLACTEILRS